MDGRDWWSPWGSPGKKYWSGLLFPTPEDLPNPGIEPRSPALQADALTSEPPGKPKVKVIQSCLSLCDPMDYTVHGILQARVLEWVKLVKVPYPSPGDLPKPGTEPRFSTLQVDSLSTELSGKPGGKIPWMEEQSMGSLRVGKD